MIKGIFCQKRDEVLGLQECLDCSRLKCECGIFPEYVMWLSEDDTEYSSKLSITKLLSCQRRAFFLSHLDYVIQPQDAWGLFRGTLSHSFLERYKDENCLIETKFTKRYRNIEILGKPDKIDIKNKTIFDYKTIAGKISDDYSLRWGNAKIEHQLQLNLYKWLIEDKFEIEKLVLVYIGSDCSQKYQVKIWTEKDKQYKHITKAFLRAETLNNVWGRRFEDIRADELEKEDGWICNYCHFSKECKELDNRGHKK